jgi:hypothetical protein
METLIQIFQDVILTNRMPIGSLMLVCTKWHQAIHNAPLLWSIIDIDVPKSTPALESCAQYCQKAVIRSRERLLDIKLSFSKPRNRPQNDREEVQNLGLLRLFDQIYEGDTLSTPETIEPPAPPSPKRSLQEAILSTLIGPKGEIMKRWKSFQYTCTSEAAQDPMISLLSQGRFSFPTPVLESFILDSNYLLWQMSGNSMRLAHTDRMIRKTPPLPCMPRVKTLKISGIELSVHKKLMNPAIIHEFSCIFKNPDAFRFMLSFQSLSRLHIGFKGVTRSLNSMEDTITFPNLTFLHISVGLPAKIWALLHTPKLENLFLESLSGGRAYGDARIFRTFPQLNRFDIKGLPNVWSGQYLTLDFAINSPNLALLTYDQDNKDIMSWVVKRLIRPSSPLFSKLDQISIRKVIYDQRSGKSLYEEKPVAIRAFLKKK